MAVIPETIDIEIQELALIGFAHDGNAIQAAVVTELKRLLQTEGWPTTPRAGTFPHRSGEDITLSPNQDATAIGTAIAHAIYGGLTR